MNKNQNPRDIWPGLKQFWADANDKEKAKAKDAQRERFNKALELRKHQWDETGVPYSHSDLAETVGIEFYSRKEERGI